MGSERAWAAGFFDGEGYVGVVKSRGHTYIRLTIGQVDREVLDRFHEAVGIGKVYGPYKNGKWSDFYQFQINGLDNVIGAYAVLKPHLSRIKREAFESAIYRFKDARNA